MSTSIYANDGSCITTFHTTLKGLRANAITIDFMKALAKERNERVFALAGRYPLYVYPDGEVAYASA